MGGLLDRPTWSKTEREVIAEWIARDAHQRPLGRILPCPSCCYNRLCPILSYVYFTGFGLVAIVLLVFFGVLIVWPHIYIMQFVEGTCETIGSRYTGDIARCSCGFNCESSYPCLEIRVRLTTPERQHYDTCLYYSPFELQKTGCSYRPECEAFTHRMSDEITRYEEKFAPLGRLYPCLYNPTNPMEVVKRVHNLGEEMVFGVVLWPVVAALTCLMFLLVTYLTCGCKPYVCIKHPPEEVKLEAKRRVEIKLTCRNQNQNERTHLKDAAQPGPSTQPDGYQSGGSLLHEPSEFQAIIDKAT